MMHLRASVTIHARDKIGEAPIWDGARARLLWSDHAVGTVHEARIDEGGRWHESARWDLGRPIAAAIPSTTGGLIVAAGTEVLRADEAGRASRFAVIGADPARVSLNDAKCDARGRLWAGTRSIDFSTPCGALYRIDAEGTVRCQLDGLTLANGLDWSPDGSTFYLIDSLTRCVDAFDFDQDTGSLANRRTLVKLAHGIPNGMTVDRDGCLWVAATGAGEVQRYTPDGTLAGCVEISTPGATSCAFGGIDLGDLFITSRSGRMPEIAQTIGIASDMMNNEGPEAGALFTCRPNAFGVPAHLFAG